MPEFRLTLLFEPVEGGWVQARIAELPAVITAGPTRAEARELVFDALAEFLAANATGVGGRAGTDEEQLTMLLQDA